MGDTDCCVTGMSECWQVDIHSISGDPQCTAFNGSWILKTISGTTSSLTCVRRWQSADSFNVGGSTGPSEIVMGFGSAESSGWHDKWVLLLNSGGANGAGDTLIYTCSAETFSCTGPNTFTIDLTFSGPGAPGSWVCTGGPTSVTVTPIACDTVDVPDGGGGGGGCTSCDPLASTITVSWSSTTIIGPSSDSLGAIGTSPVTLTSTVNEFTSQCYWESSHVVGTVTGYTYYWQAIKADLGSWLLTLHQDFGGGSQEIGHATSGLYVAGVADNCTQTISGIPWSWFDGTTGPSTITLN